MLQIHVSNDYYICILQTHCYSNNDIIKKKRKIPKIPNESTNIILHQVKQQFFFFCRVFFGVYFFFSCILYLFSEIFLNMLTIVSLQLSHYIQKVHVRLSNGGEMFFDENGDPPASYDIVNWKINGNGIMEQVKVGSYDTTQTKGETFNTNTSAVIWPSGNELVRDWLKPHIVVLCKGIRREEMQ